ncbi:221_t:CDS:1, partial [Dentiscutata heterogama]
LNINHLQSIAQIHSFYITNMKSELKFSKENFNEEELKTTINEISEALIDNSNLFDKEENENIDKDEDENDSFDLDNNESETNLNDLLIAEFMDLNFYDNNEVENNLLLNNQQ